jgi:nucleoside-diphosphate-sugar epimerase
MLGINSFPSVPFALAWLIGYYNEITARLRGKKASLNRGILMTHRSSNSFSNQKARELLGWEPNVDLAQGMMLTEAWLRAEGYL